MKLTTLLTVATVSLVSATEATARSRHYPHHHRVHVVLNEQSEFHGNSGILSLASQYIGRGKVTRNRGPWCRDFVNLVLHRSGHRLHDNSRRAIDALHLGHRVSNPAPGDIVVMRHHVTFYAGRHGSQVIGLGGNQGGRHGRRGVQYSHYPHSKVLAYIRPYGV